MKPRSPLVLWDGDLSGDHSLARVNRHLLEALQHRGIAAQATAAGEPAAASSDRVVVHVRHRWPPDPAPPRSGHWIAIQPWEWGSLPRLWIDGFLTGVDEVWVPSRYVRELYLDAGFAATRLAVIPNGVDPSLFHPSAKPRHLPTQKRFRFLFVGGTIYRKGIDRLIEAYAAAFEPQEEACLVIKDQGTEDVYAGGHLRDEILALAADPRLPEILYLDSVLEDDEMPGLFTACDCLVHPYRGEGFGMPILEAMACGLPTVVTAGGACLDFCSDETSLWVEATRKTLPGREVGGLETVGSPWLYEPSVASLAKQLRLVFDNRPLAAKLGHAGRTAASRWTWDRPAALAEERIRRLLRTPIRRARADDPRSACKDAKKK